MFGIPTTLFLIVLNSGSTCALWLPGNANLSAYNSQIRSQRSFGSAEMSASVANYLYPNHFAIPVMGVSQAVQCN